MHSLDVIVVYSMSEDRASLTDREEQSLVEQLVVHATDEALDESVLNRLARRDVVLLAAGIAG